VAWWQRFLGGEPQGRQQAAATLGRMLCGPVASATICFTPAVELLRSCTHGVRDLIFHQRELKELELSDVMVAVVVLMFYSR
jgi:hypothetical protein